MVEIVLFISPHIATSLTFGLVGDRAEGPWSLAIATSIGKVTKVELSHKNLSPKDTKDKEERKDDNQCSANWFQCTDQRIHHSLQVW
jgi:hypothetical protein